MVFILAPYDWLLFDDCFTRCFGLEYFIVLSPSNPGIFFLYVTIHSHYLKIFFLPLFGNLSLTNMP